MSQRTKPDLTDLLPHLRELAIATRHLAKDKDGSISQFRNTLRIVGLRYGIDIAARGDEPTNLLISYLDEDYPDWRGYTVHYVAPIDPSGYPVKVSKRAA